MKAVHKKIPMDDLCDLFGKSRQSYYKAMRNRTEKEEFHGSILLYINEIRRDMPKLGTNKLRYILEHERGIKIGRDALYNLLRANGLLIRKRKKYRPKTTNGDGTSIYPDLRKSFSALAINVLWSSDITYVTLLEESCHAYATFVVDEYSHLIVGWTFALNMTAVATLEALKMAVNNQLRGQVDFNHELVFHTDRGSQFKSADFQSFLSKYKIRCSMTEDGKPSDNPVSERLNGILKNELLDGDTFNNFEQAQQLMAKAVRIYNTRRLHLSCGMMTPQKAHEKGSGVLKKLWKQRKTKPKQAQPIEI